jgi:hypothetical protein
MRCRQWARLAMILPTSSARHYLAVGCQTPQLYPIGVIHVQ